MNKQNTLVYTGVHQQLQTNDSTESIPGYDQKSMIIPDKEQTKRKIETLMVKTQDFRSPMQNSGLASNIKIKNLQNIS